MVRKILAVPAGLLAGGIGIFLIESLGHLLYPLPAGMDSNDIEGMKTYVATAPFMALFFEIIAYAVGALTAGFVSTKVAADRSKLYALLCGLIFLLQSIYMMYALPTPTWFWIAGILVWFLVLAGYRLAANNQVKTD